MASEFVEICFFAVLNQCWSPVNTLENKDIGMCLKSAISQGYLLSINFVERVLDSLTGIPGMQSLLMQ